MSAIVIIVGLQIWLFRSRWGLRTRAVGEHPRAAETVGIDVIRLRYRNVMLGGVFAGLGGAWLSIEATNSFQIGMTTGPRLHRPGGDDRRSLDAASAPSARRSCSRSFLQISQLIKIRPPAGDLGTIMGSVPGPALGRAAVHPDDRDPGRRRRPEHPAGRGRPAVRARSGGLSRVTPTDAERAAALAALPGAPRPGTPRPVILDCDPGHDDALAILLACAASELDVLAVTTVVRQRGAGEHHPQRPAGPDADRPDGHARRRRVGPSAAARAAGPAGLPRRERPGRRRPAGTGVRRPARGRHRAHGIAGSRVEPARHPGPDRPAHQRRPVPARVPVAPRPDRGDLADGRLARRRATPRRRPSSTSGRTRRPRRSCSMPASRS